MSLGLNPCGFMRTFNAKRISKEEQIKVLKYEVKSLKMELIDKNREVLILHEQLVALSQRIDDISSHRIRELKHVARILKTKSAPKEEAKLNGGDLLTSDAKSQKSRSKRIRDIAKKTPLRTANGLTKHKEFSAPSSLACQFSESTPDNSLQKLQVDRLSGKLSVSTCKDNCVVRRSKKHSVTSYDSESQSTAHSCSSINRRQSAKRFIYDMKHELNGVDDPLRTIDKVFQNICTFLQEQLGLFTRRYIEINEDISCTNREISYLNETQNPQCRILFNSQILQNKVAAQIEDAIFCILDVRSVLRHSMKYYKI